MALEVTIVTCPLGMTMDATFIEGILVVVSFPGRFLVMFSLFLFHATLVHAPSLFWGAQEAWVVGVVLESTIV
jgi:hypothetical protein